MIGIKNIASILGDRRVTNAELAGIHGFETEFLLKKLGVESRHVTSAGIATSDLAAAAAKLLLQKEDIAPQDIGFICVVTQTPDYQLPHTAAIVQNMLGLDETAASFDIGLGCSGFVYGLDIATSFMESNYIKKGILITADTYSKVIDPSDRATSPLFSDAAAAVLLTDKPRYASGRGVYGTDGSGYDNLIVKCGGSRSPHGKAELFMNGRAIFNFMMSRIPNDVARCLSLNKLAMNDIDKFIFHQANLFMLESLMKKLKIDEHKMVIAMREVGNTVSSSIPIALESIIDKKYGSILISGFGVGLSWGTNILKYRE
ncbi:MAG: ketoacyl-ACP synthase III [Bacteroidetes bacterium]|nr:ketoacyl-ACP synthase III [Bacteroidota bacterium]